MSLWTMREGSSGWEADLHLRHLHRRRMLPVLSKDPLTYSPL